MRTPRVLASGTTNINMTPMIDVVFLLIIFFLVSSHMAKQENMLQLDLPSASSGLVEFADRETLVINVLGSGAWQIGGVQTDEQGIAASMRRSQMAASQPLRLKIRTDKQVAYERLEPLLELATASGIGDIVFSVYEDRGP